MISIYSVRILNIIDFIAKTSFSKIAKCLTLPPTVLDSSFCQVHHPPSKNVSQKKVSSNFNTHETHTYTTTYITYPLFFNDEKTHTLIPFIISLIWWYSSSRLSSHIIIFGTQTLTDNTHTHQLTLRDLLSPQTVFSGVS